MSKSHHAFCSALLIVLGLTATFPAAAHAQLAPAFTNPFDDPSDASGWYMDGYPFPFAIDDTPIGGHSGSSMNWNNGTDISGEYPYAYFYADNINVSGMTSPVVSFWCYYDLNSDPDPYFDYREIYFYEYTNYDYIYQMFMGDGDGNGSTDITCPATGEWHQHTITLPDSFVNTGYFFAQFYAYSNNYYSGDGYEGWFIDDFQILVADTTPPDSITDLATGTATETSIPLTWSSPFDDDVSGVADSFDIRYSTNPITGANFGAATPVAGEPNPDTEGTTHTATVTGLTADTTYYFAIRTTDIAGNVSTISNVVSATTLEPPPPPPPPPAPPAVNFEKKNDDILPCAAGTSAAPAGMMAMAGLILLAFAVRRKA